MLKKSELYQALAVTAEVTGASPTEAALRLMADRLAPYPAAAVVLALERCQTELRGVLTLGAIFDRIEDGHVGPEEAWAMVAGLEETETVVWTDEIVAAWSVARDVLPDRVGARMAFLESYRRQVIEARRAQRPPRWWVSLGEDHTGHQGPVLQALGRGRLSAQQVKDLLPPESWPLEWRPALPNGPTRGQLAGQTECDQTVEE